MISPNGIMFKKKIDSFKLGNYTYYTISTEGIIYLIALSSGIRIGIGLVYMVSFKELHYIFERNHLFNYTFLW